MAPAASRPKTAPVVTSGATVDAIVQASHRSTIPLRPTFISGPEGSDVAKAPLSRLVSAQDHRGLLLFLMLLTKASTEPWESTLAASVWARALGIELPTGKTASSTISKTWLRLERLKLVERSRDGRWASVKLKREDGSGDPYSLPAEAKERYVQIPCALWTTGPSAAKRWYEVLSLPELAVLLIARSRGDRFTLRTEKAPEYFGFSADSLTRGLNGLTAYGLLKMTEIYNLQPLSPIGYSAERRYTLQKPFGPVGTISASARRRKPQANRTR